ncbi:SH3 domain-containing protein [Metabacillus arenae]|uniref:SH3 domain-containing protein n=1 Tax=Metabacillus arenae TaxID=2771434 RepID=A0A926RXQ9_9BACI|nr:SH3 domain-containing protein [Metabacillus arenae]MBD1381241.1 SH3 domain-containing protein [Metabacillus arenae]
MARKGILLFLSIALLFSFFIPSANITNAKTEKVTINVKNLNVHSGPGLSYSVTATVNKGKSYDVIQKSGDWSKIRVSGNHHGWIANWMVSANQSTHSQSGASSENQVTSVSTELRIRTGPGKNYKVNGYFEKGEKAIVLKKSGSWLNISYNDKNGWVLSEFVQSSQGTSSDSSSSKSKSTKGRVLTSSLNVRKDSSLDSTVIGSLRNGQEISIASHIGKWYQINYNGGKGWIHSDYVQLLEESSTSSISSGDSQQKNGEITASALTVRNSGSFSGSVVATVKKGTKVTILKEKNKWYEVEFNGGKKGWIASWFVKINPASSFNQSSSSNNKLTLLYDGTNLRSGPSTNSSIAARGNEGDSYSIVGKAGDWYKVALESGENAFVASWIVSTSGTPADSSNKGGGAAQYLINKTIVIDPGHGGRDSGAIGAGGSLEKSLTLSTSKLLSDKLKASGANVFMTRTNDTYISLQSRVSTSHYRNADAFISVHFDSLFDRSVRGTTSYYYNSSKDKALAQNVQKEMIKQTGMVNRGARFGDYLVIRENKQPSTLLELGFISNSVEEVTVSTNQYQEKVSQGIYYGLAQYFKE